MLLSSENPTPVHVLVFVVEITNVIRSYEKKVFIISVSSE